MESQTVAKERTAMSQAKDDARTASGRPEQVRRPARVSAAAVARAAGVSPAAVSYVMNGRGGVSAETRRHIVNVANTLGYRPHRETASRTRQLTRVIGLIVPNIVNPMYTRWAQDVITVTAREGFEVFVTTTQDDPDTLAQCASTLAARNVDGVILVAALREDARAVRTLRQRGIPYVYLSRRLDHVPGDFVGIHDGAAAAQLMRHLLEHGYTDIATVIGPRFSSASLQREQSFIQTAEAAGVTIGGNRKISTMLNADGGRAAARHLLQDGNPPRAIACGSDEIAIGIMDHLLARGLRVPEDVAIVSCDGLPHSRSAMIGLTTAVQPTAAMSARTVELLLDQITTPRRTCTATVFEHELHIGRSCGCRPSAGAGSEPAPAGSHTAARSRTRPAAPAQTHAASIAEDSPPGPSTHPKGTVT
ncbi:LacI family DNA-binding transcriptional regulator [Sediminivirga luteola]|nr:LacI family DNA-binding transcriptional regulator [Sediminivirga luteola]MCI2265909.1 LacI family transcriptional regulator [Sediminivirga luteola]